MPSWNDGETSSESLGSSEPEIPDTIYDEDFTGIATQVKQLCNCHGQLENFAAFEGSGTGQRFLGCGSMGAGCDTVQWVDKEWPMPLKKALWALWEKYEDERKARTSDAIESIFQGLCLGDEKKKLQEIVQNQQEQIKKLMHERQVGENDQKMLDMQKQIDELKKEKKQPEYVVADLFNAGDVYKKKLKKISAILSDEDV